MAEFTIGRPFSAYEYTTIEADTFEEALEKADDFGVYWRYEPEQHAVLEDGDIWIRNEDTLEDRTY